MLNKILVSIDGSPLSFKALEFAIGLGKACGSRIGSLACCRSLRPVKTTFV